MRYGFLLFTMFLPLLLLGQSRPEQKAPAQQKSNEAKPNPEASSVNTQPPAPSKQDQPKQQTYKCPLPVWTDPFWSNWALVFVGLVAAWIALGTLTDLKEQTAATKILAGAAKKSADNDEQTVRLTQRADVLLKEIEIKDGASLGRDTRIILHVQNYGPTRADEVKFDFRLHISGVDKTGPPPLVPIVLGAGASQPFTFPTLGEITNQAGIGEIASGQATLKIGGRITYSDVFGATHLAEYRATLNPAALSFVA